MWSVSRTLLLGLICTACAQLSAEDAVQVPCVDEPDAGVDAGFCDVDLITGREFDDGGDGTDDAAAACPALLVSACGESGECARDPGCVAADLTARFEPERCAEAAADARAYPPCELGTCAVLKDKVCGVAPPDAPPGDDARACADAPGCAPVMELAARADEGDVSADASCAQALSDEVLFPACGP
jgi:hypothetical protein